MRDVRGGLLSFGMFGSASAYLIADLASTFRRRHPDVRVRLVGRNSSEVADAVRDGRLEAGLVVLPVDDTGLEVRPFHREELVVASRDPARLEEPMTIERFVEAPVILYDTHHRLDDPTRRQLDDRAQRAGVVIRPVIEVESVVAAVALAARGDGDTVVARTALRGMRGTRGLGSVLVRRAALRHVRLHRPRGRARLTRDPRDGRDRREAADARDGRALRRGRRAALDARCVAEAF